MSLPQHPNALTFTATLADGASLSETYYSVGGGFILQEGESEQDHPSVSLPFPIESAEDLLDHCSAHALGVPEVVWRNELAWRTREAIQPELGAIWRTMKDSVFRGCHTRGVLPGGLGVVRRAAGLAEGMLGPAAGLDVDSWLENGAAGVVPAVLLYHLCFCGGDERDVRPFLLTAAEIGSIIQKKATISAAMGGCQAEIGVSSAMAAAGLTQCLGGSPAQVAMAAEIALEHHLGMTRDPVAGLVQIPCIERNTMGAVKAITASTLALAGEPAAAKVPLGTVIGTMWETAQDMSHKYKETAEGGLALRIAVSVPEC